MPLKNLVIIVLASLISMACYPKSRHNRFAGLVAEAMDRIVLNYVEPVGNRELFEGAMKGMLGELDQYSSYIGPEEYAEFQEILDQEFGGIGIMVELNRETNRLTVLSPVVGTPAYRAGIQPGDMIVAVDGESTEGVSLTDAVDLLRGAPGTKVRITVLHPGDTEPVEITVSRAIITVPSILGDTRKPDGQWKFVLDEYPNIGYLRMATFGEHTAQQFEAALRRCLGMQIDGLIIDLRFNAGGLLTAAVKTCDMFIEPGSMILSTRGRGGKRQKTFWAESKPIIDAEIPVAVLINNYSASASEIVAACLQDHGRAVIVGERSWGKGTVQNVIQLERGRSIMKLTTATYWRPSGKNIHRSKSAQDDGDWGVVPDEGLEVKLSEEEFEVYVLARRKRDYEQFEENSTPDTGDQEPSRGNPAGSESTTDSEAAGTDGPPTGDQQDGLDNNGEYMPFEDKQLDKAVEYLRKQVSQSG